MPWKEGAEYCRECYAPTQPLVELGSVLSCPLMNGKFLPNKRGRIFVFGLILGGFFLFSPLSAQTDDPYLVSATIYLSVDNWADVWLNGVHIVDQQPHTPPEKGFKTIKAKPSSLCYFTRENILALEVAKSVVKPQTLLQASIGLAYILKMRLSDGREVILASSETDQHRAFYIPDEMDSDPSGWQFKYFNDAGWISAFALGATVPDCAQVKDPDSGVLASFLSARSQETQALHPGERHLFRRYFSLPISQSPYCLTPTAVIPKEVSRVVEPEGPRHPQMPRPPRPTPTQTPRPTPTPLPTAIPAEPLIPTPRVYIALAPTATPWPTLTYLPAPWPRNTSQSPLINPVATPTLRVWFPTIPVKKLPVVPSPSPRRLAHPAPLRIIISKPTPFFTPTPTVNWEYHPPVDTPTAIPVVPQQPTATFGPKPVESQAQTMEVEAPPANLYVSFSDGPGVYRLAVYDSQNRLIRPIYQKKVVAEADDWALWDGKDESGRPVAPGYYLVVFTKDGGRLKDVILHLVAGNP